MGQGMGNRLLAREADAQKQEGMLKAVAVLENDIENWVTENREYEGLPDIAMIVEQHGLLKKRIVSAFSDATIWRIEFKVLTQIQGLHVRIDNVKKVADYKEHQKEQKSNRNNDDVFIDEPRDTKDGKVVRTERVLSGEVPKTTEPEENRLSRHEENQIKVINQM